MMMMILLLLTMMMMMMLGQSMEQYRQRCDNLGNSLHGLMDKIEDERFFGDLATEVRTEL